MTNWRARRIVRTGLAVRDLPARCILRPMRQLLAVALVIVGVLAMGSDYLPAGIVMVLVGATLFRRVSVRAEELFTGLLMIAGALGALVPFVQYAQAALSGLLP